MKKNNWNLSRKQWIILGILASLTIFILVIDAIYLFRTINNPTTLNPISKFSEATVTNTVMPVSSTTGTAIPSLGTNEPTSSTQLSTHPVNSTETILTLAHTLTPSPSPTPIPKFFINEWDKNTNNWSWFSTGGDDNLWDVYNEADVLVFTLLGKDTNAYFVYEGWDYDKVMISTQVEVRTETKSSTVIVCNYSESIGWYEFNIGTNGLWEVRLHDTQGKTGYLSLQSGGSLAIQTGKGTNEYTATCDGNHLSLSINGSEVLDYTDPIKKFQRGKIGLGVFSYSQVPVLVESAWVKVSQP